MSAQSHNLLYMLLLLLLLLLLLRPFRGKTLLKIVLPHFLLQRVSTKRVRGCCQCGGVLPCCHGFAKARVRGGGGGVEDVSTCGRRPFSRSTQLSIPPVHQLNMLSQRLASKYCKPVYSVLNLHSVSADNCFEISSQEPF